MKQEDKIWTTEPLVFIILLAFGLWIAYDFGESQGMKLASPEVV
jgi:transposase